MLAEATFSGSDAELALSKHVLTGGRKDSMKHLCFQTSLLQNPLLPDAGSLPGSLPGLPHPGLSGQGQ